MYYTGVKMGLLWGIIALFTIIWLCPFLFLLSGSAISWCICSRFTAQLIFISLCYWNKSCPELQELSGLPTQKQIEIARKKIVVVQSSRY